MTNITAFELQLLRGIKETIDEFAQAECTDAEDREQQELAKRSTVDVWLPWFLNRDPSPSEVSRASRAWRRLSAAGYLQRLEFETSTRTAQLLLTPEGRLAASDPAVEEAVRTPRTKVAAFVHERCDLTADGECDRTGLYIGFVGWCEAKNYAPMALQQFEQQLLQSSSRIGRVHRKNGERAFGALLFTGISLRPSVAAVS